MQTQVKSLEEANQKLENKILELEAINDGLVKSQRFTHMSQPSDGSIDSVFFFLLFFFFFFFFFQK